MLGYQQWKIRDTVYPKKYAHGFVVLCFVVVMQLFIMNSHEVFIHIHQGCFAGTGAIVRLPQCQWSKPGGYGKISQCITTTKHSKAKTVCIFLGIYCTWPPWSHFQNIGRGKSQKDKIRHLRNTASIYHRFIIFSSKSMFLRWEILITWWQNAYSLMKASKSKMASNYDH